MEIYTSEEVQMGEYHIYDKQPINGEFEPENLKFVGDSLAHDLFAVGIFRWLKKLGKQTALVVNKQDLQNEAE